MWFAGPARTFPGKQLFAAELAVGTSSAIDHMKGQVGWLTDPVKWYNYLQAWVAAGPEALKRVHPFPISLSSSANRQFVAIYSGLSVSLYHRSIYMRVTDSREKRSEIFLHWCCCLDYGLCISSSKMLHRYSCVLLIPKQSLTIMLVHEVQ